MSEQNSNLSDLLRRNRDWAQRVERENPGFFYQLSHQQKPEFLWIGCSDSRVPANQIIDLAPGEVFVHRNIANVVSPSDLNCLSVIQFAVDVLKVKHILVVGHYGCGGVEATLKKDRLGLVDNWLRHVGDIRDKHHDCLQQHGGGNHGIQHDLLCELNALEQAVHVAQTTIVNDAWNRGQELTIHAWVYSLNNGQVTDLGFHLGDARQLPDAYRRALQFIEERSQCGIK